MLDPQTINPLTLPSVPLEMRSHLPEIPAIYFCLTPTGNTVYIGETSNLYDRWARYSHSKKQQCQECGCDRIAWLSPVPEVRFHRLSIEKELIRLYRPVLNMQIWNGLRRHDPGRFYDSILPEIQSQSTGIHHLDKITKFT